MSPSRLRLPWAAPSAEALRRLPGALTALPELEWKVPLQRVRLSQPNASGAARAGWLARLLLGRLRQGAERGPDGNAEQTDKAAPAGRVRVRGAGRDTQRPRALSFLFLPLILPQVCLPAEAFQHRSGWSGAGRERKLFCED